MLRLQTYPLANLQALLSRYDLSCQMVPLGDNIPGSFWGDDEAGLIGSQLYLREDTPVHSALHEACHFICMTPQRRVALHTNAGGNALEESAVCYLQCLLADQLPDFSREQCFADMDEWGYSFRMGDTRSWFEQDAEDAQAWLLAEQLITAALEPTWRLRQSPDMPTAHNGYTNMHVSA